MGPVAFSKTGMSWKKASTVLEIYLTQVKDKMCMADSNAT